MHNPKKEKAKKKEFFVENPNEPMLEPKMLNLPSNCLNFLVAKSLALPDAERKFPSNSSSISSLCSSPMSKQNIYYNRRMINK